MKTINVVQISKKISVFSPFLIMGLFLIFQTGAFAGDSGHSNGGGDAAGGVHPGWHQDSHGRWEPDAHPFGNGSGAGNRGNTAGAGAGASAGGSGGDANHAYFTNPDENGWVFFVGADGENKFGFDSANPRQVIGNPQETFPGGFTWDGKPVGQPNPAEVAQGQRDNGDGKNPGGGSGDGTGGGVVCLTTPSGGPVPLQSGGSSMTSSTFTAPMAKKSRSNISWGRSR